MHSNFPLCYLAYQISIFDLIQIIKLKPTCQMNHDLSVEEIFHISNRIQTHGIQGYHVDKKYVDPLKQIKDRQNAKKKKGEKNRNHVTKRGNYLEDEQKLHKAVPGPGQYPLSQQWSEKSKLKIAYADKKTFIEEIMKRQKKQKKPAPGQYNVEKTIKEVEAENKRLAARKIPFQDRITYLDGIQYDANLLPGVGNYNPRKRAKTEMSPNRTKPEDWRKKHELLEKKKPPKTPDMGSYKPLPADYTIFENLPKGKNNKNLMGKVERFKTFASGSGLNPAKYTVIQEWKGKDNAKKRNERHGIEVTSKFPSKSVYYH